MSIRIPPDAKIALEKIKDYLLVPREWDDKSKFLAQAGFFRDNPEALSRAIRKLAADVICYPEAPKGEEAVKLPLYQRVALRQDLLEHGLRKGDVAVLVDYVPHPGGGEDGCVLEVFNALGESMTVITVRESEIEGLRADEVLTIRHLAKAS